MAWKVSQLKVDLLSDSASITMNDNESRETLSMNLKITTPGNHAENRLKEIATEAAWKALQGALDALQEPTGGPR